MNYSQNVENFYQTRKRINTLRFKILFFLRKKRFIYFKIIFGVGIAIPKDRPIFANLFGETERWVSG
jgi:hypothetical protein